MASSAPPTSTRRSSVAVLLLALGALSAAPEVAGAAAAAATGGRTADDPALAGALAALGDEDPAAFETAWERLVAAGAPAARAALGDGASEDLAAGSSGGWVGLTSPARVARARLLEVLAPRLAEADGGAAAVSRVVPLLAPARSPEPEARAALVRALGTPALAQDGVPTLADVAADDPSEAVRAIALAALAESAEPAAAAALDALLPRLADDERPEAARALAALPAARTRVVGRVQQALLLEPDGRPDAAAEALGHHATLANLARGYGRALAELPRGGEAARDRAPLLLLRVHPSPLVRLQGARALDRFLSRLVELREEERAERVLATLAAEGLAPREVLYRRARLALAGLGDVEAARRHARTLVGTTDGAADAGARGWRHYGLVLLGAAEFADGDLVAARAAFDAAAEVLHGLVSEREDLRPSLYGPALHPVAPVGGALVVDRLVDLGLVEVWRATCALAEGHDVGAPEVLEPLRHAHALLLTAQLHGQRTDSVFDARSLDDFLDRDLGPRRLLLSSRELPGGEDGRYLDLQLQLGRALATVVPQEVLGFERARVDDPALGDVFRDDERFALLVAIAFAERDAAQRAWFARRGELAARVEREDDPAYLTQDYFFGDPEFRALYGLIQRDQDAAEGRQRATAEERADPAARERLHPELRELRTPSLYALTLADELRADGRSPEARALAERMLADLRTSTGQPSLWQEWISARLELAIASAWMDEDRPREAERAGLAAVRRLEALERSTDDLVARAGDDRARVLALERQRRQIELLRADALLSLAVNANVRAEDPERALTFFERAFELDQREFMRVLLACYRARSGRAAEARAVLRGVQPAPSLYYNLACTYALLGEPDEALEFLRRELEENQPTPGALARQRAWAREDPDLRSLRDDPRFVRLTAPE